MITNLCHNHMLLKEYLTGSRFLLVEITFPFWICLSSATETFSGDSSSGESLKVRRKNGAAFEKLPIQRRPY